jgi:hypothetical protein
MNKVPEDTEDTGGDESNSSFDPFLDRPADMRLGDIPRLPLEARCVTDRRSPRHAAQVILVMRQYGVVRTRALCDEHAQEEIRMMEYFLEQHATADDPTPGSYKFISLEKAGWLLQEADADVEFES